MTPNFALSLSYDGLRLAYRASDGWRHVGEVSFDTADMTADMAELRAKAEAIAPGDMACKLILPDDQIRYLTTDAGSGDPDAAARAVLDGATPYAVDELSYDVSTDGAQVYVAAVAKETLAEANAFARENDFHPVSAVAVPPAGAFHGEPAFDPTGGTAAVPRDNEVVVITGDYEAPAPQPQIPPAPPEDTAADETTTPATGDTADTDRSQPDTPVVLSDPVIAPAPAPAPADPPPPAVGFASRRSPATAAKAPALAGAERQLPAAAFSAANITAASIPVEDDLPDPENAPVPLADDKPATKPGAGFFSRRKAQDRATPVPARGAVAGVPASEAQRLTVFGARKAEPVVGGKPRFLGLILTAALLVFLAGVAAWATVFMDDGLARFFGKAPDSRTVAVPEALLPEPEAQEAAPLVTASLEPELSPEDAAVLDALQDPLPDPVASQPDLSIAEQEARYAVTGIWPVAPLIPQPVSLVPLDDLYITSIDPLSPSQDAVALPDAGSLETDQIPGAVSSPAAPGTSFALDDRGWVIPTPQGAVTPDNVTVYLGKPPVVPPARPEQSEVVPEPDTGASTPGGVRPKSRPSDLIEKTERSQLGGVTLSELGGLRPRLRPGVLRTQEEEDIEAIPEVAENPLATATRLAVAASARPDPRPRNFARTVERARKQQATEPPAATQVAAVAPRTVTPKIPSSASVAKEATVRNALNLGRVNLIGVTGKPSSRRALVRLANGRMKPVKVGDRIDGGRVTAIGDSELRYQKGNRSLVLKMPKG